MDTTSLKLTSCDNTHCRIELRFDSMDIILLYLLQVSKLRYEIKVTNNSKMKTKYFSSERKRNEINRFDVPLAGIPGDSRDVFDIKVVVYGIKSGKNEPFLFRQSKLEARKLLQNRIQTSLCYFDSEEDSFENSYDPYDDDDYDQYKERNGDDDYQYEYGQEENFDNSYDAYGGSDYQCFVDEDDEYSDDDWYHNATDREEDYFEDSDGDFGDDYHQNEHGQEDNFDNSYDAYGNSDYQCFVDEDDQYGDGDWYHNISDREDYFEDPYGNSADDDYHQYEDGDGDDNYHQYEYEEENNLDNSYDAYGNGDYQCFVDEDDEYGDGDWYHNTSDREEYYFEDSYGNSGDDDYPQYDDGDGDDDYHQYEDGDVDDDNQQHEYGQEDNFDHSYDAHGDSDYQCFVDENDEYGDDDWYHNTTDGEENYFRDFYGDFGDDAYGDDDWHYRYEQHGEEDYFDSSHCDDDYCRYDQTQYGDHYDHEEDSEENFKETKKQEVEIIKKQEADRIRKQEEAERTRKLEAERIRKQEEAERIRKEEAEKIRKLEAERIRKHEETKKIRRQEVERIRKQEAEKIREQKAERIRKQEEAEKIKIQEEASRIRQHEDEVIGKQEDLYLIGNQQEIDRIGIQQEQYRLRKLQEDAEACSSLTAENSDQRKVTLCLKIDPRIFNKLKCELFEYSGQFPTFKFEVKALNVRLQAIQTHIFTAEFNSREIKLPLPFQLKLGYEYEFTVTMKMLSLLHKKYVRVLAKQIRHREVFLVSELRILMQKAENFLLRELNNNQQLLVEYAYRNKPRQYFDNIRIHRSNIMEPYKKDNNGDPGCPINNQIEGLFFAVRPEPSTMNIPDISPFGDTRIILPIGKLIQPETKFYFADFYCISNKHYVTIVATKPNSSADKFCEKYLLKLSLENNPFFKRKPFIPFFHGIYEPAFYCCREPRVEILYTEKIDLRQNYVLWENVRTIGRGSSTPGGIPKRPFCRVCNL